jgi:hypothetical protein
MRVYVVIMLTHVDACVAKKWISYRCVPCHPWCTHRKSLVVKQKSVFLWLWTSVIVITVCNHGEHYETPCIITTSLTILAFGLNDFSGTARVYVAHLTHTTPVTLHSKNARADVAFPSHGNATWFKRKLYIWIGSTPDGIVLRLAYVLLRTVKTVLSANGLSGNLG